MSGVKHHMRLSMRCGVRVCLLAVAVFAPSVAGAQTTTADGARALVRGDYETAVRILRPLAENTSQPDPLAKFFMAMLYSPGLRGDITRGCGLYLAAATGTNPLAAQSLTLARTIQDQLGDLASLCVQQMAPDERPLPSASVTKGSIRSAPAAVVSAQTTTADGVEALVRGDYQLAAKILRTIAEKSPQPDHAASFLMGTFYENGLGVAADRTRACALYMQAADPRGGTPFAVAANTLVRAMHESMTLEEFQYCELLASIGFDNGFQPVTFELEPGHWISWDLKGATISYGGKETYMRRPLGEGHGIVFLPLQHTVLTVGRSGSTRRDFIEVSTWAPARDRQNWTLRWDLYEVVRNELIGVAGESSLTTVSAQEPPTAPPFDVHEFARVRVGENGNAEWAVLAGPRKRTEAIESDAVRQEEKQQKLKRAADDARVNWKLERDVHRAPALTYIDSNGCGNVFLYAWSEDRTEAIAVRADKSLLQLSTTAQTFDIASTQTGLEVVVYLYERPLSSLPFCTDVITSGTTEAWRATGGTVTIELSAPGVRVRQPNLYRATIRINGAEFVNGSGVRIRQVQPITLTALVGGIFG